ncbi:formate/nitrite transporter family protein [Mangrovibrevibacter kandeliae]|uniref:formate/nitrite transporter family protein n=1 Tax=Mangrovibrevibacter kandeliae TaxID=2968473 RepID=UPI002117FCCB|nr:formate/nitrite transporter family protein [Aurantimonas sp. CSK15Z-1]MCQ8782593.1 formate/nitrite transporter family protein [Aurantimonas sp. CSK15Z-1]
MDTRTTRSNRRSGEHKHPTEATERRLREEGSPLTPEELKEVSNRSKLRPLAVYEIVRQEGEQELERPTASLLWSGLAAGLSIGFSVFAEAALRIGLPDSAWRPLVENWGYSVGFLIVILARQQLFTEITITAVLPVFARPSLEGVWAVARLWGCVLLANILGTAVFGAGIALDVLHLPEVTAAAKSIATEAVVGHGWWTMLLRAIAAGWLMATIVWLLPSADQSSFPVIALMTYLIALFDLTHIVAGSVEAMTLVFSGDIGVGHAVAGFYVPALIGNVIGGAALFALVSYAQVSREMTDEDGNPVENRRSRGRRRFR